MKKIFLFAIAAATMATGCAKLQEIINPGDKNQPVEDNSPVEIQFTTNVATVNTKANGAVTAFSDAHTLYIYGLNKDNSGEKEIINAPASVVVTEGENGTPKATLTLDKTYFYNGTNDTYDFYGYYVDDAVTLNEETNKPLVENGYAVTVTITGQQDILLAKAKSNETTSYSAKTARTGTKPNLVFEHQLSQFQFNVRNCGTYGITLKGLALNTVNKGTLTVAGDSQNLVASTESTDKADLEVSATETTLAMVDKTNGTYTKVGSPVMVFPGNTYTAILYLYQDGMDEGRVRKVTVPVKIVNAQNDLTEAGYTEDPGALKGYAYELNVTVYSLEQVSIEASLTKWKKGHPFNFDTEDYEDDDDGDVEVDWPNNDDNTDNGGENPESGN